MSSNKIQAAISTSRGWADAKIHPVSEWMENYTRKVFNTNSMRTSQESMQPYHTSDFTYVSTDGSTHAGFGTAFAAIQQIYAPFTELLHEPRFYVVYESGEAGVYELVGEAVMYADLPVAGGDKEHADETGRKWDLALPSMFHFWYVKDEGAPGGFKLKKTAVFADTFPAVQVMMQRGMVKA